MQLEYSFPFITFIFVLHFIKEVEEKSKKFFVLSSLVGNKEVQRMKKEFLEEVIPSYLEELEEKILEVKGEMKDSIEKEIGLDYLREEYAFIKWMGDNPQSVYIYVEVKQ